MKSVVWWQSVIQYLSFSGFPGNKSIVEAVNNQIKELVIELQSLAFVSDFGLAGGTNLAIQFNHRVSDDIDLFSDKLIGKEGFQKIKTILVSLPATDTH